MRSSPRGTMVEPSEVIRRYESATVVTGIDAPCISASSTVRMIRGLLTSALTPSWMAIYSTSSDSADMPHFTEWKRSLPPATHLCTATSKRAIMLRHRGIWSSGSTTTISALGSASAKVFIVRATTGIPPSIRNCLGSDDCIRWPEPPATIITPRFAISVSCQNQVCCP